MRKIFFLIQLFLISIFFNACFLTSIFDFGPKINLAKSHWQIASFDLDGKTYEPVGLEEMPMVSFDTKELKLNGSTGCNTFFASYTWIDEKIEVRNSGMTRKMCDEISMRFEQKLMEEFDGEFEVIEEGPDLILKKENLSILLEPKDSKSDGARRDILDAKTQNTSKQEGMPKKTGEKEGEGMAERVGEHREQSAERQNLQSEETMDTKVQDVGTVQGDPASHDPQSLPNPHNSQESNPSP